MTATATPGTAAAAAAVSGIYLTRAWSTPTRKTLREYEAAGGYRALRKALALEPAAIIDAVKKSNLRGAGGAGFPAGLKWSFVPKDHPGPKYLAVNSDESEPGTFKDRYILERDPHMLIEGAIICALAVGIETIYVYVRGEYVFQQECLDAALAEAYAAGCLGDNVLGSGRRVHVHTHRGAGAYICGEETGMLESLEGKRGMPRLKPPFPAIVGLFGKPTVINNVETLACVPLIIDMGAEAFAKLGCERNGGTKIFGVSGHVARPGLYEFPMGITTRAVIDRCGGMRGGRALKGVIPGGSSTPVLTPAEIDHPLDFDTCRKIGTMFGTAAVIVMDETTCMVDACARIAKFYEHESCGQCTPCRDGTGWMWRIAQRIEDGQGRPEDIALLLGVSDNVFGNTICALADGAAMPISAFVKKYTDEFRAHIDKKGCPFPPQPIDPCGFDDPYHGLGVAGAG
jgi:NADH-quinone oxidoreductase subunit F